jgi:hypothetical protein
VQYAWRASIYTDVDGGRFVADLGEFKPVDWRAMVRLAQVAVARSKSVTGRNAYERKSEGGYMDDMLAFCRDRFAPTIRAGVLRRGILFHGPEGWRR